MRSFWGSLALATVAATATAALIGLTGCTLYFDHHGDDTSGDDQPPPCGGDTTTSPALRLVNPETLACQTFPVGGGCDSSCGPCPESAPYIPPWGSCASECIGKSEVACSADPACYVAKEASKYYGNSGADPQYQVDDFLGCYPHGSSSPIDVASCDLLTAEQCSSDAGCTAIYNAPYGTGCGDLKTATPEQCPGAELVACVKNGLDDPGVCQVEDVTCESPPPQCPQGQQPGWSNGCATGACIPAQYCGLL